MRHRLAALPDCEVSHAESLDGDGFVADGGESLMIRVVITKRGARVRVDFTGTSPTARGPVNAPLPVTASSVYYTLIGLAGGDIQPNSGAYSVAEIVAPAGSLVHAVYPAAVVAANTETSNRIVDVLLGALAKASPDRVPAGSYGSACVVSFGGHDPARGRTFVHYETVGGGMGGLAAFLPHPQGEAPRVLASKSGPHRLNRGDVLEIRTAGGGGWGSPA